MEAIPTHPRSHRGHDAGGPLTAPGGGHLSADAMRWERGGTRGLGRGWGRGGGRSPRPEMAVAQSNGDVSEVEMDDEAGVGAAAELTEVRPEDEPVLETLEERERFYQELVKAREAERKKAIADGKMDDPLVPKRLDEAITMVGTCMDMCPRFERYRRERENNLFNWEVIPGTKRVDHKRAVKIFERAAGDKTLPSDLRPPPVLKRTLDYLFRDLILREGFSPTCDFVRDRSRAVRNDFTMQHETGEVAMECHERCARFHILALHFERERPGFSVALEEQQLMYTLQSLKEFYEDQRSRYESPNELEMRIYHRLIHIRDQRERHDDIPLAITNHAVFLLTTKFRQHVQAKSSPITKTSPLVVDEEAMELFAELATLLREQGNMVMVYLVACILERLFGKDTIEDIESIREGMAIPDIIDGVLSEEATDGVAEAAEAQFEDYDEEEAFLRGDEPAQESEVSEELQHQAGPLKPSATEWLTNNFGTRPSPSVMFGAPKDAAPASAFGSTTSSAFGPSISASTSGTPSVSNTTTSAGSAFAGLRTTPNAFGSQSFGLGSAFGGSGSVFGTAGSAFGGSGSAFGGSSSAFGSTPSALGTTQTANDPATQIDPQKPSVPFSPFGASTSTPSLPNVKETNTASSAFGSPFAKPAPSASQPPAKGIALPSSPPFSSSQSAPSGIFSTPLESSFGVGSKPLASIPTSAEKNGQPSTLTLNPAAPTFTPGQAFSVSTPPAAPLDSAKKPASGFFSSSPSTSTHPTTPSTRPVLPPINTSPLSSLSASATPPAGFPASQSAPSLNGVAKRPSLVDGLERQPTLVDGFESASPGKQPAATDGLRTPGSSAPPQFPPPLKVQPISLPETPTGTSFNLPSKKNSINNLFGWPSMQSGSGDEILSPLVISARNSFTSLPSPVSARSSFSKLPIAAESPTPTSAPGPSQDMDARMQFPKVVSKGGKSALSPQDIDMASPITTSMNGKSKGKGKAFTAVSEELEAQASSFARTSALVRDVFRRWSTKASERVNYNDAVRRSDAYAGRKAKRRQEAPIQADAELDAKPPRRARRRVSAKYVPPLTDAELTKRLKENHEQHERRWAPGTFLAALRAHIGNPAPFDYSVWLSLNPDNDGTAIWVEKKFDVPGSGAWASEHVFAIPLAPDAESRSPGLVVFECTTLHGVDDEIEKKFRVLDDCARLREIIETFLKTDISFDELETLPDDLRRMVDDYERKGVLGADRTFALSSTTKDLDEKFTQVLKSMNLDTSGALVEILSRQEFLQLIIAPWKEFASDWIARCTADGEVDWLLFSRVFEASVRLMNVLSRRFTSRLDESAAPNPLPEIRLDGIKSSNDLYDTTIAWLEHKNLRTPSREFRMVLQSYRTSNADFPVHVFTDQLYDLSIRCIEDSVQIDKAVRYPVPKRDIEETRREVESDVAETAAQLQATFLFHVRPKRPPPDDDEASVLR
ncbi:SAC3/GANP/Nin1/mts3/eIF-3 p25 family-domain-containing protein [Gloeopeniophorella convolvens]|nr:SAC3/GANP/Nin1/mts3/eIF-3 p25 family-domain-containing protein [Gloeopeniophorella convolvens]